MNNDLNTLVNQKTIKQLRFFDISILSKINIKTK